MSVPSNPVRQHLDRCGYGSVVAAAALNDRVASALALELSCRLAYVPPDEQLADPVANTLAAAIATRISEITVTTG